MLVIGNVSMTAFEFYVTDMNAAWEMKAVSYFVVLSQENI